MGEEEARGVEKQPGKKAKVGGNAALAKGGQMKVYKLEDSEEEVTGL